MALAWVFAVSVLLQVFFAGLALFVDSDNWTIHGGFARVLAVVPLLMLAFAWIARLPRRQIGRSAGLLGMVIGMFLTAVLSPKIGALSALHPVIALMMFWACAGIIRASRQASSG